MAGMDTAGHRRSAAQLFFCCIFPEGFYSRNDKKPEPGTIAQAAKGTGYTWSTIKRAKDEIGIIPYRESFCRGWRWRLPDQEAQEAQE